MSFSLGKKDCPFIWSVVWEITVLQVIGDSFNHTWNSPRVWYRKIRAGYSLVYSPIYVSKQNATLLSPGVRIIPTYFLFQLTSEDHFVYDLHFVFINSLDLYSFLFIDLDFLLQLVSCHINNVSSILEQNHSNIHHLWNLALLMTTPSSQLKRKSFCQGKESAVLAFAPLRVSIT